MPVTRLVVLAVLAIGGPLLLKTLSKGSAGGLIQAAPARPKIL